MKSEKNDEENHCAFEWKVNKERFPISDFQNEYREVLTHTRHNKLLFSINKNFLKIGLYSTLTPNLKELFSIMPDLNGNVRTYPGIHRLDRQEEKYVEEIEQKCKAEYNYGYYLDLKTNKVDAFAKDVKYSRNGMYAISDRLHNIFESEDKRRSLSNITKLVYSSILEKVPHLKDFEESIHSYARNTEIIEKMPYPELFHEQMRQHIFLEYAKMCKNK